ncbi:hypothetical protein ACOSP7_021457 [Xanthoceras sorbifolium]
MGNSNGVVVMLLQYERLPGFYFGYGYIGYSLRECLKESNTVVVDSREQVHFRAWLRVTGPPKVTGSCHSREAPEASTRRRSDVHHEPVHAPDLPLKVDMQAPRAVPVDEGENEIHGSSSCHATRGTLVGAVSEVISLETAQHMAYRPETDTIEASISIPFFMYVAADCNEGKGTKNQFKQCPISLQEQCVGGGVDSAGSGVLTRADSGPIQSHLGSGQQVHMAADVR